MVRPYKLTELEGDWESYEDMVRKGLAIGGGFRQIESTVSIIIVSVQRQTVYYVPRGHGGGLTIVPNLITLLFGWWGIPFGPIKTVRTLLNNRRGGRDVTQDICRKFNLKTMAEVKKERSENRAKTRT